MGCQSFEIDSRAKRALATRIVPALVRAGRFLLLPILSAGLLASPVAPAPDPDKLPDAATAAAQVAEEVFFEDVVRAVSYSRSRKGRYLSFGAAYPKQVLSVWAPDEVYEQLAGAYELGERRVRIRGKVEKSSTGPVIKLTSPEQLELLPLDEAILAEPRLDGRTARNHFMAAIVQDFEREQFAKLEILSRELHQSRERFTDGTWMLDAYFRAFDLPPEITDERYEWSTRTFEKWRIAHPASITAIILQAALHVDRAWKGRGTGFAATVTKEGQATFRRELAAARRLLEAVPATKASPHYYVVMQSIALGEGWPKDDYFRLVDEGIAREPDYYGIYFAAAHYLLPRWNGRRGEWERFAETQRQRRGGPEGDILYTRIVWSLERFFSKDVFKRTAASWDIMAAGFEAMLRAHPDSDYLKNAYAHFAWRAGDRERLRTLLAKVKDAPDMAIWVNLENVRQAQRFAESSPPPAR